MDNFSTEECKWAENLTTSDGVKEFLGKGRVNINSLKKVGEFHLEEIVLAEIEE